MCTLYARCECQRASCAPCTLRISTSPSASLNSNIVVALVRPSRTHHRFHPIRYHIPLLACSHCLLFDALERPSSTTASESAYGISIRHLRTTGCALVCATAADAVDGRTGSAMVGGTWHSWLGFWREWLGRAHLSGMYPSLLHNRGFDACSTCSLHLVPPTWSNLALRLLVASGTFVFASKGLLDKGCGDPVSYTHLTLPTICSV